MNSSVAIAARSPVIPSRSWVPLSLLYPLQIALSDCGAWILRREQSGADRTVLYFEFPRDACAEVYGVLVSLGLQLTDHSHEILTELCSCTPDLFRPPQQDLAVWDTPSLRRATDYICSLEIVQAELEIRWSHQDASAASARHSQGN